MYVVKRGFKPYEEANYIKDAGFTVDESFLLNIHHFSVEKDKYRRRVAFGGEKPFMKSAGILKKALLILIKPFSFEVHKVKLTYEMAYKLTYAVFLLMQRFYDF
ncbi:hypothetical protein AS034_13385 [[Bacillus] enclensis]|uniref:Uncharacterized protein n=1 Tax=[Bacillus] enclensis TaxID=1402860 RepID=A0A0V8HGB3_9BACI|nr:hypothetical protein [[Bacillus] enclensis]KSU61819.1 hypothetical protein AS034_13385 [[Bacillus] enclensis]SCC15738.1 hypothetical protein GA0061094_2769 [[Bacillus] enclensis]